MSDQLPAALSGRYVYGRLLGSGGFGRVVLAKDTDLDRAVAIKLLDPGRYREAVDRERFDREARLTARVDSPHVARLYDYGIEDDQPYIVFEFVKGRDLEEAMRGAGGPLPMKEADRIMAEVLEGLAAAHQIGIVHRDLKPENILIEEGGRVVITDFGLAREEGGETLTRTGTVMGTILYMAPEQMTGEPYGPPGDLYAAALVYYEMASGQLPFDGATAQELYEQRFRGLAHGLRDQGVRVAPGVDRFLRSMLAPEPEDRPATADEALCAFRELRDGSGPSLATVTSTSEIDRDRVTELSGSSAKQEAAPTSSLNRVVPADRRRLPAALGLAFLAALLGGWAMGRSRDPMPPPPPTSAPEDDGGILRQALLDALQAAERNPRVRAGVRLVEGTNEEIQRTGSGRRDQVLDVWRRGYEALWREVYRKFDLPARLRESRRLRLDPVSFDAASRLLLFERLLSRTSYRNVERFDPTEDSGLEELVDRHMTVASPGFFRTPAVLGGRELEAAHDARVAGYLKELEKGERRWVNLRGKRSLFMDGLGNNPRIRPRNYAGVPFIDPVLTSLGEEGAAISELFSEDPGEWHRRSLAAAPSVLRLDSAASEGDLVLTVLLDSCVPTHHVVIEMEGEGPPILLTFPASTAPGGAQEAPTDTWWGKMVLVDAAVVPRKLRRLKVWVASLQPVGSAEPTVNLGTVLQQVAGPPPDPVR